MLVRIFGPLLRAVGVPESAVGYAGLKDRHALTRQRFSVQLPGREAPALDALAFDVGDFVQFDSRGEKTYGVVESYWRSNHEGGAITGLYVDTVSGVQTVDAGSVSKADLPESVLRLAKARLQANCPLKETACAG